MTTELKYVARLDAGLFKAGADQVQASLDSLKGSFESVKSNITGALGGVSGMLAGVGVALGAISLGGLIKDTVSTMSAFEQLEIQLRSVMGSVEAGDQAFAWIKKFAAETPFEVTEVTKAFMLLKNMGLDPMDGTLNALADQSAKAGQGAEGLQRTALAMGQAFTKGKLQGEEMNQLLEAGVPAWDLLSKAMNKSVGDLQEMAGKGTLGRDAVKALIEEIGKASAGSAGAAMASLSGQVSNLHDNLANFADDIRTSGGLGGLKDILGEVNQAFSDLRADGTLAEWAAGIAEAFTGISGIIGSTIRAVIGVVQELGSFVGQVFNGILQALGTTFGGESMSKLTFFSNVLKVVEIAVISVGAAFKMGMQLVRSAIEQTGIWLVRFSETASAAMSLDFEGAKAAWARGGAAVSDAAGRALDEVGLTISKAMDQIETVAMRSVALPRVVVPGKVTATGGTGTGKGTGGAKDKADSDKADPSQMPTFEAALASARAAAVELDAIHGMSKAQELAYWQQIAAQQNLSEKDKLAVSKKVSQARIALLQEQAQQEQQLSQIGVEATRDAALARVELDSQAMQERLQAGEISQSEALAAEQAFEDKRYAIKRAALDAAASVLDPTRDPVQLAQTMAQIEQLEQQHQLKLAQIRGQTAQASALEQGAIWADLGQRMGSLWDQGVNAMMNGTLRWSGVVKAVGLQLGGWFGGIAKDMAKKWLLAEQAKTGATIWGATTRLATEAWAAIKSTAIWAASAAKNIMLSAWQAMAGAYAAIAGIPYVGPILAPITAGVVFAGVAGLVRNVASAEGGYDIPAGVNPLTQLHEREMVLPARHADTIRALGESGGLGGSGGSGGDTIHLSVQALDGASVKRVLLDNQAALAASLRAARRNGHLA